ncbi:hypothetical protein JTB14_008358 [Gonioctena quinquepunctata]|nr:hypothetical protein JTB14_008358 [Gonioctena quinquepunctata]
MKPPKFFKTLIFVLVLILAISQEVECRRRILRGRKALTRRYMMPSAIPAYAIIILVTICQLVFGGLLYVLLKICILDKPIRPRYQVAPADA